MSAETLFQLLMLPVVPMLSVLGLGLVLLAGAAVWKLWRGLRVHVALGSVLAGPAMGNAPQARKLGA